MAQVSLSPPRVDWVNNAGPAFLRAWGRPNGRIEAEHVAIIGPTGSGKSTVEAEVIVGRAELRDTATAVIATKPADRTLTKLGWPIISRWPPKFGQNQVILWPRTTNPHTQAEYQKPIIKYALGEMWIPNSNRIVCFDEVAYIEQELALKSTMTTYYREARALGISMVATTQRPRYVSRYLWSEASWIFAFRFYDMDDAKRVAEIMGGRHWLDVLLNLRAHEFVLLRRVTGEAIISKVPG